MFTFNNWVSSAHHRHYDRIIDAARDASIENRRQLIKHFKGIFAEENLNQVWQLYEDARLGDAVRRFARVNGWRPANKQFSFAQLAGLRQRRAAPIGSDYWESPKWHNSGLSVLDHLYWFRADRKPAAIATMPYPDEFAAARRLALRYELDVQTPPKAKSGWWFPGMTELYVFVPRGVTVNWLPEQLP